jgi:la-related protein 1
MYHPAGGRPTRILTTREISPSDVPPLASLQHRRSNSDNRLDMPPLAHHYSDDYFDRPLESLIPRSIYADCGFTSDEKPPDTSSLDKFDTVLGEKGVEEASKVLGGLLSRQPDHREQGKVIRSAAEIAKRQLENVYALQLYEKATEVDPQTPGSWLDRAKLLDGLGHYSRAEKVLQEGVLQVPEAHSEQLIRKVLKSFERSNTLSEARSYLASLLSNSRIDRDTVLIEGAFFELRQGNVVQVMSLLSHLRGNGWKPGVYAELIQYFEKWGIVHQIRDIVEEGAVQNPRNAVILRCLLAHQNSATLTVQKLKEFSSKWTSEFTDKMTTTVCEILAQGRNLRQARLLLAEALYGCIPSQRHKLLIIASTIELVHGDGSLAPLLLDRALGETPYKSRPLTQILWAKVYEHNGQFAEALELFQKNAVEFSAEWRVFLELAQFHLHRNNVPRAIAVLCDALKMHPGSGRLWAFRVQLEGLLDVEEQIGVLRKAIEAVPKSGEVWCEAARIALNPLTEYFNLTSAKTYLDFAYRFTPQHGETLIEMVRLGVLEKGPNGDFSEIRKRFMCSEGNYGMLFVFIRQFADRPLTDVFRDAVRRVQEDVARNGRAYARAIARSAFVPHSILEEKARLARMRSVEKPGKFALGLTTVGELMLNPRQCKSKTDCLNIIMGTSGWTQ